ncbi:MAG: hypothetical protein GYA15_10570 [Leptolinea sp.]|jgi:hypothetical protein|nr:hypothetical protein [Leptolinea sp.]
MAVTLENLLDRITCALMDTGVEIWPFNVLEEAIRQALGAYSQVFPCLRETTITIPASGDLDLSSLPGLCEVIAVRWPYEAEKNESRQPPNRITGWRFWRELDRPILELRTLAGCDLLAGEDVYIRYTCGHSIAGLDEAGVSTVPEAHSALLVRAAAGYAALFRAVDRVENRSYGSRRVEPSLLQNWGEGMLEHFHQDLEKLRRQRLPLEGRICWRMDAWDTH